MKCSANARLPLLSGQLRACCHRRAVRRPAARVACAAGTPQDWGREDTDTRAAMAHIERDLEMLRAFERQNEDGISSLAFLLSSQPASDAQAMPAAVLTPEQLARVVKEKRNALDELDRQAALLEEELSAKQQALEALMSELGASPQPPPLAGQSDKVAEVEEGSTAAQAGTDVAPQAAGATSQEEDLLTGAQAAAAITAAAAAAIASRSASREAVDEAAAGSDVRLLRGATVVAAPVLSWHEDAAADAAAAQPAPAAPEPGVDLTPHAEWVRLQQGKLAGEAEPAVAPPPPAAELPGVTFVPDIVRLLVAAGGDTAVMVDEAPTSTQEAPAFIAGEALSPIVADADGLQTAPDDVAPAEDSALDASSLEAAVELPSLPTTALSAPDIEGDDTAPVTALSVDTVPELDDDTAAAAAAELEHHEVVPWAAAVEEAAGEVEVPEHRTLVVPAAATPSNDEAAIAAAAAALLALPVDEAARRVAAGGEPMDAAAQALAAMAPAAAASVLRQLDFVARCQLLARLPWQTRQDLAPPVEHLVAPPAAAAPVERLAERAAVAASEARPPPPAVAQKRSAASGAEKKPLASLTPKAAVVQPPPPATPPAAPRKAPIERQQQRLELLQANGQRWIPFLVLKSLDVWMRLNGIVLV